MTKIGFHASHEQISPQQLLQDVIRAEHAGFDAAMCSDHFFPWSNRQAHSGFAFSWLGAALASTEFPIGSVTAPGQRYHPAITAQATATLAQMFPGRYWAALGSGQNLNEHVTGGKWPDPATRRQRLEECVQVIRALHAGKHVSHHGLVTVEDAYLFERPLPPPKLYAACVSPDSARRAAAWADGMLTLNQPRNAHHDTLEAYRQAGGTGPVMLQAHLSWDPDLNSANRTAYEQWRTNAVGQLLGQDLPTPEHLDAASQTVDQDKVGQAVWISDRGAKLVELILESIHAGFKEVYLHQVAQDQQPWIDYAAEYVLPTVREQHVHD